MAAIASSALLPSGARAAAAPLSAPLSPSFFLNFCWCLGVPFDRDPPACGLGQASSSRVGLGRLGPCRAVPCAAQTRASTWALESVPTQTPPRPPVYYIEACLLLDVFDPAAFKLVTTFSCCY
jgi:hypothetical protein